MFGLSSADPLPLVADIGGTNARFALAPPDRPGTLILQRSLRVKDYPTLADAAEAYIAEVAPDARPRAAMLAVAAGPSQDEVRLTNSHWNFSISATRERLGLDALHIVNDFAANSWAVLGLDDAQLLQVGGRPLEKRTGNFVTLGPGTGLGVGGVSRDTDGRIRVTDTEGGHVDFAPLDAEEDALLHALRKRFGRVSYERLVCGQGLANIFGVLTGEETTPEEITARAASGDAAAIRAIDHFCAILGSFAGDAVLMLGAWEGVFLCGGMLHTLSDSLLSSRFRQRFEAKGRFSPLVAATPTMLVLDPDLGLRGSAAALRALQEDAAC
jgi:glucokinase